MKNVDEALGCLIYVIVLALIVFLFFHGGEVAAWLLRS